MKFSPRTVLILRSVVIFSLATFGVTLGSVSIVTLGLAVGFAGLLFS